MQLNVRSCKNTGAKFCTSDVDDEAGGCIKEGALCGERGSYIGIGFLIREQF